MKQTINGVEFRSMFISGAAAIENARQSINELNVFPVPDGDTGINMSLTMNTAVAELLKQSHDEVGRAAETAAGGLLRGARGNSGVILSLLFRGFAKHVKHAGAIDGADFALALADGVEAAYRAVMKPSEGTILTVSRVCAAKGKQFALEDNSMEAVLEAIIEAAYLALQDTIEQNPVLKKAGVIDAGAKGFCIILDGMMAALRGEPVTVTAASESAEPKADFAEYASEDIRFTYCTEFIILRQPTRRDPIKLRAFLGSLGDSLVFVDDEQLIKVHVHTNNPGKALEEALLFGALTGVKIENMREQHTSMVVEQDTAAPEIPAPVPAETRYGFVAVASGDGIAAVMRDLGVNHIVEGGQTMNPSTEDILRFVNLTPAEIVFVLPNNKNIIMAAEQCAALTEKTVIVLPTKTIPQGIAALLAFDMGQEPEINREAMMNAMSAVTTGHITYAARDSQFDGADIRQGDYMALVEGKLLVNHKSMADTLNRLAEELGKNEPSYLTVFYGQDITEDDAALAVEALERYCPSAEVSVLPGGQPVYYYLISAE